MRQGIPRLSPYDRPSLGNVLLPNVLNFEEIPADAVYVFEKNKNSILFDVYNSPSSVAKAMGLDYYYITRNIKKKRLICFCFIVFYAGAAAIPTMVNRSFSILQNPLCLGNSKRIQGTEKGVTRIYKSIAVQR